MGQKVRSYLASEIKDSGNRIEAEALGLRAFLKYVAANPSLYRVLQEAQFVDESIYQEYYNAFGRGYLKMLADATQKEKFARATTRSESGLLWECQISWV